MATVQLFGYSDDNIEIRGDLGEDEFGAWDKWKYLHFNDGTVIKGGHGLVKGKGWHFEAVRLADGATATLKDPMMEDGDHYSDVLEVTGNFTSVKVWDNADGPTKSDLVEIMTDLSFRDYTREKLLAAYTLLEA